MKVPIDRYCENLFARGFEARPDCGEKYDLLTAFEVFEHLPDPWNEIQMMARLSDNIAFSTELLPSSPPPIAKWWYYAPEHGQHISFFTEHSLDVLAERLGSHVCTNGANFHLMTKQRIPRSLFKAITHASFAKLFSAFKRMPSLLTSDFERSRARLAAAVRDRV